MPFDTLSAVKRHVAEAGLSFCKSRYGRNGLKVETEIDKSISWKPTFHLKPNSTSILAAEVDDVLYPEILKIAAHDILIYEFPIEVYLICPLEVYLADSKQATINKLKDHGFGIITVDENGTTTLQYSCIPLAQHISERELEAEIQGLTPKLKVCFKSAHATYRTNQGQGLQEAGQIIEALVNCMAKETVRLGFGTGVLRSAAADTIDNLYGLRPLKDHRAALGGARNFIKTYRNVSSHAPRSAKEAMDKIKKCRVGFFDAIRIAKDLQSAMKAKAMRTSIHLT